MDLRNSRYRTHKSIFIFTGVFIGSCILCISSVFAQVSNGTKGSAVTNSTTEPDSAVDTATVAVETEEYRNLSLHRQTALNTGSICGVLFLGYVNGGAGNIASDSAYLEEVLDLSGCAEECTFLKTIPDANIVEIEGGNELYCIYPCDEKASLTVHEYIIDESNNYSGEAGEVLYHSDSGEPILLRCNVSECVADCQVTIEDSQREVLTWVPMISLYDGTVSVPWDAPFVYDATYDVVEGYGIDTESEYEYEGGYEGEENLLTIMKVVNCNEWVSLREYPDVNSNRLIKIPLGALVHNCVRYSDEFVFGEYNGLYGYVLSDYLEYFSDEIYSGEGDSRYSDNGYFYNSILYYEELMSSGNEILNYSNDRYHVVAVRSYDNGETLCVGCYNSENEPLWGYITGVNEVTELTATDAFVTVTGERPGVIIGNSLQGLHMIDMETGEVLWLRSYEELHLTGSVCLASDEDGTMYAAGYYGAEIVAIAEDGTILWWADPDNNDVYWPYEIIVEDNVIVVNYFSGTETGHFVVAYRKDGSPDWMDILPY
ncbi:MAG: hypothetical protein SOY73_07035 [Blautia sp.]|nr:PQQ-like beta-propeller repeat protein [Blautia sp.]MDY3998833.1 hypothetical protein [Blautia sp.]